MGNFMRGEENGEVQLDSKDWLNLGEMIHNIIKPQGKKKYI